MLNVVAAKCYEDLRAIRRTVISLRKSSVMTRPHARFGFEELKATKYVLYPSKPIA